MASHTPNLDLLKKDPVTDGSETFNIETMLNENWDKIDTAMGQVREELADIDIPLSDATNGNRSDVAASEKAVGQVMSAAQAAQTTANAANTAAAAAQTRADQAFQLGNERKAEVVAALVAKGISASTSESWDSLIAKMAGIIKATGNATAAHLLQGYTASNAGGPITGAMINRSVQNHHQPAADTAVFPGDRIFLAPPQGYYNGDTWVAAPAPNFKPENIRAGVDILGIVGAMNPKQYAEGLGALTNDYYLDVTGLSFKPAAIGYYYDSGHWTAFGCAIDGNVFGIPTVLGGVKGGDNSYYAPNCTFRDNGFRINFPGSVSGTGIKWFAMA